jgi:Flp pilus assembly protein TadB
VIAAALCGAGFGLAALIAWRALVPARPPLRVALARGTAQGLAPRPTVGEQSLRGRAGTAAGRALLGVGIDVAAGASADLAVLERPIEQHVADKVVGATAGFLLPWAWWTIGVAAGITVAPGVIAVLAAGLALAGFLLPDLALRAEASKRRREFTQALGAFLDLVVIALAGGAGIESALDDAASIGRSRPFGRIRETLDAARLRSDSPWDALGALGQLTGVSELVELGASVSLAGTEGSRVRQSLTAKAAAMRDRDLAEEEARAQSATERMAVPTVMLMAGFILLVGYPAVRAVTNGL